MGIIPKQTKAENKLMWGFTLNRMIGLLVTIMVSSILAKAVHRYLVVPFMIFCVIIYLFTQMKSPTNPKKKFISGLKEYALYLSAPKKYHGITGEEYELTMTMEEERNEKKTAKAKNTAKK